MPLTAAEKNRLYRDRKKTERADAARPIAGTVQALPTVIRRWM
jgi:hypothetical protein